MQFLEILFLRLDIGFPMLKTENRSELVAFRGNGFYNVGNGLLEFPKLEIGFSGKFLRKFGEPVSGDGNSKT